LLHHFIDEMPGNIPINNTVVEGEIQKVRVYKDYMVFFELAGEGQSINCFSTFAELDGELPEEGSKAQVSGEIQLGKKTELRFRVRKLSASGGVGDLEPRRSRTLDPPSPA
jgi:exonuclease VII large subunit